MSEHKYERIARLLRADLPEPGRELPSEAELRLAYDASRHTVRQALDVLESEGLISSSQGMRRIVRDGRRWCWPMAEWESKHTSDADAWANTIKEQGGEPASEIHISIVPADAAVAAALDVTEGQTVVVRERVRRVNGEPHQLSDSYFPRWLTDSSPIFTTPGDQSAAGGLLAASGYPQKRFHDEISARPPTTEEISKLSMPTGTPLLIHTRIGYAADSRPLRYMVTRMTADRVELSYDLLNEGP